MRNIDWDTPLSQDDELWLQQRLTPELVTKIAQNRARFGDGEDLDSDDAGEEKEDYSKWTSGDLKAEAEARKIDISGMKKKAEVVLALEADDAAKAEAAKA